MDRREFLKISAAAAVSSTGVLKHLGGAIAAEAEDSIPKRVLGETGEKVSIIGFGGGSRFCKVGDEDEAVGLVNQAIDMGICYFDTAPAYGSGLSEKRYGNVMKFRRKEVFLATKTNKRTRDGALADIEASLKRLQTDRIDLIQMHAVSKKEEIQQIGLPDGALAAVKQMQDEGVVRFVGITGHPNAEVIKEAIQTYDFDTVMVPLNATRGDGYEKIVLPEAQKKKMGIMAMKTTGQNTFVGEGEGKASALELIRYSLSLPIAVAVIGMDSIKVITEDVKLARSFEPMSKQEMEQLHTRMAKMAGTGYWSTSLPTRTFC